MRLRSVLVAAVLSIGLLHPARAAPVLGQGELAGWTEERAYRGSNDISQRTFYCRAEGCPRDGKIMILVGKGAPFGEYASYDEYLRKVKPTNAELAAEMKRSFALSARGAGGASSVKVTRKGNVVTFDSTGSAIMPTGPKGYFHTVSRYSGAQFESVTAFTRDASKLALLSRTAMLLRGLD